MSLLSVPLKTVLMYHSDLQNETVPESYEICDGRLLNSSQQDITGGDYQLPDLRNVFILGADPTKTASSAGTSGPNPTDAPGPKGSGGANSHSISIAELPSHGHPGSTVSSNGAHTHSSTVTGAGGSHIHTASSTTAGAHEHSGSSMSAAGAHTHGTSSMSTAGAHSHGVFDPGHLHAFKSQNMDIVTGAAGAGQYSASYVFFSREPAESTWRTDIVGYQTTGISIQTNGDHIHTLNIGSDGSHQHTITLASDGAHGHPITVDSGGSHTHTVAMDSDGDHTHTVTIATIGSGTAIDTRPRYYGLVMIMKVRR